MLSDWQVIIVREQMETIAAPEVRGSTSSFTYETSPLDSGAIAARRRRMEIRRFKLIANSGPYLEPHNKPSRPVSDQSRSYCDAGEMSPLGKPEYDFVLQRPMDNDKRRNDDDPRWSLRYEGDQTITRPNGSSTLWPVWERPSAACTAQNGSSGEDGAVTSGSISTSSGSSSVSSDSTSTRLESNEVEGGSSVACMADAAQSVTIVVEGSMLKKSTFDSYQAHQDRPVHHAKQLRPLHRQGSLGERDRADLSAMPSVSSSGSSTQNTADDQCPPHGMVSICGRRREMEDAVASIPAFLSLPCDKVGLKYGGPCLRSFHFFAVYDGHGGSQAALYCTDRMHHILAEEMKVAMNSCSSDPDLAFGSWDLQWQKAMLACFLRLDAEVGGVGWRGGQFGKLEGSVKCCEEPIAPETVGSTAVVAVVSSSQLIVANCGDSRAVLSRRGHAIALSCDHKPEREDEMARVEAAGGRVIFWNGYRVLGVLAMSRAIGDRYLKPYVIAEPEVTCTQRTEEDECLILASDGLWDVLSNEVVCDIARKCIAGHHNSSASHETQASSTCNVEHDESPAAVAAALLTKLALARGSSDNISVVVVDLMTGPNR